MSDKFLIIEEDESGKSIAWCSNDGESKFAPHGIINLDHRIPTGTYKIESITDCADNPKLKDMKLPALMQKFTSFEVAVVGLENPIITDLLPAPTLELKPQELLSDAQELELTYSGNEPTKIEHTRIKLNQSHYLGVMNDGNGLAAEFYRS